MSSSKSSYNNAASESESGIRKKTNHQLLKEGGWGGMNNFMLSYGLKMYNHEDVEEANRILDAFREDDYEEQLERQKRTKSNVR